MPSPEEAGPYIAAVVAGTFIAAITVLGILWLRPQTDAMALLGAVGGLAVIVTGQAISFIKGHETGKKVDKVLKDSDERKEEP